MTDKTQEFCNKLNDYSICVAYSFTSYKKSSKGILEFLSPYLLKNAFDIEYIKAYIPEAYIKESNKNDVMELLGKREVRDYLDQKSSELVNKSPVPSTPSTQRTHLIMIVMKLRLLEQRKRCRILNKLDITLIVNYKSNLLLVVHLYSQLILVLSPVPSFPEHFNSCMVLLYHNILIYKRHIQ
ncbi:hypothetical protein [Rickettsia asiatica]|uniref:hypothetical protein n=1 Tax=Rickettsia asiatica TaxID=238800 RepID=UPI001E58A261|nr:hypothetical protein [Rickettsia asiatica]